jgi:hypothetical protein
MSLQCSGGKSGALRFGRSIELHITLDYLSEALGFGERPGNLDVAGAWKWPARLLLQLTVERTRPALERVGCANSISPANPRIRDP